MKKRATMFMLIMLAVPLGTAHANAAFFWPGLPWIIEKPSPEPETGIDYDKAEVLSRTA